MIQKCRIEMTTEHMSWVERANLMIFLPEPMEFRDSTLFSAFSSQGQKRGTGKIALWGARRLTSCEQNVHSKDNKKVSSYLLRYNRICYKTIIAEGNRCKLIIIEKEKIKQLTLVESCIIEVWLKQKRHRKGSLRGNPKS